MKLVSFNIGLKINNSDKVAQYLKKLDADILCLQEVVRHFDETVFPQYQSKKIIDEVIRKTYPYAFFGPQWKSKYVKLSGGRHRDYGGYVEQGNYILSKYPIISSENKHYLYKYRIETDHTRFKELDHPRSVAISTLNIGGKILTVFNIHGTWSKDKCDTERSLKQSEYLINEAKKNNNPLLIVGDFNVSPKTKSISIMSDVFNNMIEVFNIQSSLPNTSGNLKTTKLVDYIFTNEKVIPISLLVPSTDISDHLPLVFDFDIQ